MSNDKINDFKVVQGIGELKNGFTYGDFSRVSLYSGNQGVHTGSNSPTCGRNGNLNFGINSSERQTTLQEFGIVKGFSFNK